MEPDLDEELTLKELEKYARGMVVLTAILMRDEQKAPELVRGFADELEKAEKGNFPKKAALVACEKFEAEYFKSEPPLTEDEIRKATKVAKSGATLFDMEELFRTEEQKSLLPN
jgi:hypothetical protein